MTQQQDPSINYKDTSSRDFILGAIIGGVVGATTALFLAPKSGTDLRNDLNTQAVLLKERSYEWKDQAVTKGTELATTAKEKSNELSTLAKEKSAELSSLAKEKSSEISQTVQTQSNAVVEKVKSFKGNSSDSTEETPAKTSSDGTVPTVTPVDPATPKTDETPININRIK